jgi:hypothetical protein
MVDPLEQFIATIKKLFGRRGRESRNLTLGQQVIDDQVTRRHIVLSTASRTMHVATLGKSGSAKSSLLKHMSQQDIAKKTRDFSQLAKSPVFTSHSPLVCSSHEEHLPARS